MAAVLVVIVGLASAASAHADVQSFFFHLADPAAAVPGGTSGYVIDDVPPIDATPHVFEQTTPKHESTTFPTFTSTAFPDGTTLLPIASVRLYLAANNKMRSCAAPGATIVAVGTDGSTTPIGGTTRVDVTVPQGSAGGTVGAELARVEFALTDTSLAAGEGFAVTTSLTNDCSINRRTFLAYDGGDDPTGVRFQCCFTTAAKCAAKKIKLAAQAAKGYLQAVAKGSSRGRPTDPIVLERLRARLTRDFAKRDASGLCPTTNDAAATFALIEDFAGEADAALDPLGPTRENQCQYKKLSAVATRAIYGFALEAKAAATAQFHDVDPEKLAKCRAKLAQEFGKRETKGGCDTTGDLAVIEAAVQAFITTVSARLACPCP